jgi:cation:H+ antiporter
MIILKAVILFVFGLVLTIKGADLFIKASCWLADVLAISKAVIGAAVIAFATSAPEFFVSLLATIEGYEAISTANVIGSLICNLGLGFAIIATCMPHKKDETHFIINGLLMIAVTAFLMVSCLFGYVSVWHGIPLLAAFFYFTYVNIKHSRQGVTPCTPKASPAQPGKTRKPTNAVEIIFNNALFVFGIVGLIFGAEMVVDNAEVLAHAMGVTDYIIGLTVVAIGTSLPEIITTIVAITKKEHGLSVGNIIGSNIFDATAVIAAVLFVGGGMTVSKSVGYVDLAAALLFSCVAIVPTLFTKKIQRWQGFAIGLGYIAYTTVAVILG